MFHFFRGFVKGIVTTIYNNQSNFNFIIYFFNIIEKFSVYTEDMRTPPLS